ncbi:unnamed protein product [Mytilus coruscus]|uniref:Transposable element P transposase-like RNase H domain-containing protein n=1 Tax=Mytilus coruscus TaxID=42192 RepID=A0A6J8ETL0_MYTCO|nr:unnamed protein product [Mytilus coruscus]
MLKEEAAKMGLFDEQWMSYFGLLFDEVKVKKDLVNDKNTGELVGYVDLDSVGNQILELVKLANNTSSKLAKFMLVLMVKGVTTSLKFPFAAFTTTSITADFLYPIIWKGEQSGQHFGHLRHKTGANNNPTVYEVRNIMIQIRTKGAQALAPKRGNTQRGNTNRQHGFIKRLKIAKLMLVQDLNLTGKLNGESSQDTDCMTYNDKIVEIANISDIAAENQAPTIYTGVTHNASVRND